MKPAPGPDCLWPTGMLCDCYIFSPMTYGSAINYVNCVICPLDVLGPVSQRVSDLG